MLSYMNANLTFFHQGYDFFSQLQPFMKQLSGQVQRHELKMYICIVCVFKCEAHFFLGVCFVSWISWWWIQQRIKETWSKNTQLSNRW